MRKKLTRTGNSLALVLDRALLEQSGIYADTPRVVAPVRSAARTAKLKTIMERVHARYAGAFKRLAE